MKIMLIEYAVVIVMLLLIILYVASSNYARIEEQPLPMAGDQ